MYKHIRSLVTLPLLLVVLALTSLSVFAADATVIMTNNPQLGSILTDSTGKTLYIFTKDTPNTSVCYDKCAIAWPPLLVQGTPMAGAGVSGKLGVTTRTDGTQQVTLDSKPLYYYFTDAKPGDVTGENVGGVWFVIKGTVAAVPAAAPTKLPVTGAEQPSFVLLAALAGLVLVSGVGARMWLRRV